MKAKVKIISGGQTGADRAALDFAMKKQIPHGGWCPKGRLAEDGPLHQKYKLKETKTANYDERTLKNVLSADATLIFCHGELSGGSLDTLIQAQIHRKPVLVVDLNSSISLRQVINWLKKYRVKVLNVAGPRASKDPLIYEDVKGYLRKLLNENHR